MPKNTANNDGRLLWFGVAGIVALTLWRVVLLAYSTADLFVDEAQYWQWGQQLEFGYYSKPPLIGWVIRAFTELGQSDSAFWIRLPGPLFHAVAGLILLATANRLWGAAAGAAAGVVYVTMPAVALGSFLISTDTILLPFFALSTALYLWLTQRPSAGLALGLGAALGAGMMAKYAAIYFVLGAGLGAIFMPDKRLARRDLVLATVGFFVVFFPNIWWNLQNGLTTVAHTADNVDWVKDPSERLALNFAGLGEFFGGQFGVMGPVFFGAYLVIVVRLILRGGDPTRRWLVWMSLPIILLICVQAILSRAYANWAAPAYIAAVLLTAPVLVDRARVAFWVGLGINLAISIILPVCAVFADRWEMGDRLVLGRYVDRAAMSARILDLARQEDLHAVVSDNRDLLADLFHAKTATEIDVFSVPFPNHTPHYYAQRHSFPDDGSEPALLVLIQDRPFTCPGAGGATEVAKWRGGKGAYRDKPFVALRVEPDCWAGQPG